MSDGIRSNFTVKLTDIQDIKGVKLDELDIIILGASIRYGRHRSAVYNFIKDNKNLLLTKKTAFFTVNVVARKKEKSTVEANPYMQKFLKKTDWYPNHLAVFAGKIDYPSLKTTDRYIIKLIMWLTNGPTDTNGEYEFTNWTNVKEFAKEITS